MRGSRARLRWIGLAFLVAAAGAARAGGIGRPGAWSTCRNDYPSRGEAWREDRPGLVEARLRKGGCLGEGYSRLLSPARFSDRHEALQEQQSTRRDDHAAGQDPARGGRSEIRGQRVCAARPRVADRSEICRQDGADRLAPWKATSIGQGAWGRKTCRTPGATKSSIASGKSRTKKAWPRGMTCRKTPCPAMPKGPAAKGADSPLCASRRMGQGSVRESDRNHTLSKCKVSDRTRHPEVVRSDLTPDPEPD